MCVTKWQCSLKNHTYIQLPLSRQSRLVPYANSFDLDETSTLFDNQTIFLPTLGDIEAADENFRKRHFNWRAKV